MLRVTTCRVSHVTGHVSCVTCHMFFLLFFFDKVVKLIGGGSVIKGVWYIGAGNELEFWLLLLVIVIRLSLIERKKSDKGRHVL